MSQSQNVRATTSIWELPDDIYKDLIEEEIGAFIDDDGWVSDELALCFGFDDMTNPDRGFLYWARRHWHLTNKDGVVVLFRPNAVQWHWLLNRKNENVILKSRKLGMSTIIGAAYYWRARRREHQHAFIVAHTQDAAAELWSRIEFGFRMIKEERPFLHAPTKKSNRREIEWTDNFSRIRIMTAAGKGIGRAADADMIHLSEAGHYIDLKNILASIGEAKRTGCWLDMESSPNGHGPFRDEYFRAKDSGKRAALFFPWFQDPKNTIAHGGDDLELTDDEARLCRIYGISKDQIAWRRSKHDELGILALQEQAEDDATCFLLGGTPLFDVLTLREIKREIELAVKSVSVTGLQKGGCPFEGNDGGRLTTWEVPVEGRNYVIGADIAEGIPGLAWSVACVLDVSYTVDRKTDVVCRQVAEWRGHINPYHFGAEILAPLGHWYNRALIAPERNNHGHATIAALKELTYPRIYKHRTNMNSKAARQQPKYGFPNSGETRPQILALLRKMLSRREFEVRSLRLLDECLAMQAEEAHHDADVPTTEFRDCIFAAAIALFVRKRSMPIII